MAAETDRHGRRSVRLKGYDYSRAGMYFVTICTHNRSNLFGEIVGGEMRLNDAGHIAEKCWSAIPTHFPNTELDVFVIMPNHVHGIVTIAADIGTKEPSPPQLQHSSSLRSVNPFRSPARTLGSIVRGFKIGVTKWFRVQTQVYQVWQRNYYERIIRDDAELERSRQYIIDNPGNWVLDTENPDKP